ncbi:hypothetical protein PF66_02668 [Pseudomonas asplenii]|uniref:DUF2635 domain-containing protein n=1 Tax=Pseudomonas asplenii TaxID=53407 RepID=A0A0M9GGR1_9PSED|nr:DUF2635 domain-containing protein [Pseudomonas fuscovaginae]KPA90607.1 hypothetical protein PF66_02668 [Pseudomonas fuscovaginae]
MQVTAALGLTVPMEADPRKQIGQEVVEVPDTSYYRRRIASGELLLAQSSAKRTARKGADE